MTIMMGSVPPCGCGPAALAKGCNLICKQNVTEPGPGIIF